MATRPLSLPRIAAPRGLPRLQVRRPRPRTLLISVVAVVAVAGSYMWFRNSPLVAASDVTITGVHGPQADVIRRALQTAAGEMTTMNLKPDVLRAAVHEYPFVKSLSATADFPHKLRIEVVEHTAVATVSIGGRPVPVAEDGTILRGAYVRGLTPLSGKSVPVGDKLTDPFQLAAVHILAAAPEGIRSRVTKLFMGTRGIMVRVLDAPLAAFGGPRRAEAKWLSLDAMLRADGIAAATLIDVTVPERPAVTGMTPPVTQTTPVTGDTTAAAASVQATPAATTPAVAATPDPAVAQAPQTVTQTPVPDVGAPSTP